MAELTIYQIWQKVWKLLSVLLMPLKGKLAQDEYNDDCKRFMNVNKNSTNQLTQLRNAFLRHTAALLGCLMVKSQNTSFPLPDKEHSILKSLYGQLSSCERLLKHFSFVFHTLWKRFFVLACVLSKAQQKYLQRHYSCQYLTVDWQLFFCMLVKACWSIALAGRSQQWNWTPFPQSQISANLKGLLLKECWVSKNQARKENNSFFCSFLVLIAT